MEFLPPYTMGERSRELCHSSKALRWRVRRTCSKSRELSDKSARLLRRSQDVLVTALAAERRASSLVSQLRH